LRATVLQSNHDFSIIALSAKTSATPIPTLASKFKLLKNSYLQKPEEASASEINTPAVHSNYSGKARQSLAMTGFAARLV